MKIGEQVKKFFWIIPLGFYTYTACRYPGWIDAPMIARDVYFMRQGVWVNTHNLFYVVGRLWSLLLSPLELHYALNLLCAVLGAVTVYFVFLTGLLVTENLVASLIGALALMFSHSLWWHSTIVEVYTLNTALLSMMLYGMARYDRTEDIRYLMGAVFLFGVSVTNHVLMGLFIIAFLGILLVPAQWKIFKQARVWWLLVGCLFLGCQYYLLIFFHAWNDGVMGLHHPGWVGQWSVLKDVIDQATGGHFKRSMFPKVISSESWWNWKENYIFLLLMNYPSVAFPLGFLGLATFWRRKEFRTFFVFSLFGLVAQVVWSCNYLIWDMYAFGLPVWVLFGFLVILGADIIWKKGLRWRRVLIVLTPTLLIGPYLYQVIPEWSTQAGFWQRYFEPFSYVSNLWDPARYFANPNKRHYDTVKKISDTLFDQLPGGSHLFDDDGKGDYPFRLYYQEVLNRRPDLHLHAIFGPTLNDAGSRRYATEIKQLLDNHEQVFVSSPFWPERPVLNDLYLLLKGDDSQRGKVGRMTIAELEDTFPKYTLRHIPLQSDGKIFIYQLVLRDGFVDGSPMAREWQVEGEDLTIESMKGSGSTSIQSLEGWSHGAQLFWIDGKKGDELRASFILSQEMDGTIWWRPSLSFDYARYDVWFDDQDHPIHMEGYAPTTQRGEEQLLFRGKLSPGRHRVRVRLSGHDAGAGERNGFGVDYLRIVP